MKALTESQTARLTLDSGSIITRTGLKDITLTADDFQFWTSAPGRDLDPDREVGGVIGTGELTILTSNARRFLIGTTAQHELDNDWTFIRDEFPAFLNYPDHVGGTFEGPEGDKSYADDGTLFIDTVHFSTRDLSALNDEFTLVTFGAYDPDAPTLELMYSLERIVFGDAYDQEESKKDGAERNRDSSFRNDVIFNAERIYIQGEVEAQNTSLVTVNMNTERLHVKSKNINNPLGGRDSGIIADMLELAPEKNWIGPGPDDYEYIGGVRNRIVLDGWMITNFGNIDVNIRGEGEY
jgi:hypothetical protein